MKSKPNLSEATAHLSMDSIKGMKQENKCKFQAQQQQGMMSRLLTTICKDNNPRSIEEIRREAEEEQQRLAEEIAKNQQNDKRNMQGSMDQKGGPKGSQQ